MPTRPRDARRAAAIALGDPDAIAEAERVAAEVAHLAEIGGHRAYERALSRLRWALGRNHDLDHLADLIHQHHQS